MIEFLNWWVESNWRVAFALIILVGLFQLADAIQQNVFKVLLARAERSKK